MKISIIGHIDMDAFFASVEAREKPYLKERPIVVGADPKNGKGRGVVATANYQARKYGIKSAMPISEAWRLSQEAKKKGQEEVIFLRPNFRKYEKISKNIYQILKKFSPLVEQASIDEFYFDLSFSKSFLKAKKICQEIKKEIQRKEKLTSSIGIGPNKLLAKLASGMKKPDGLTLVFPSKVEPFLENLPLGEIPGIGPKTEGIFLKMGIKTIKKLKELSKRKLKEILGKRGEEIYQKIRGQDFTPLIEKREIKSIGREITFPKDTLQASFLFQKLGKLCDDVFLEFKKSNFKFFKKIVITVRFENFETKTFSKTFNEGIQDKKRMEIEAMNLFLHFLDKRKNPKQNKIRLIGLRIGNLI